MNAAFRRSEALERLENFAEVVVEHLALVTWFPTHRAKNHWNAEIQAFLKRLRKFDNGKDSRKNFTEFLIVDALNSILDTNQSRDYLIVSVESHGVVAPEDPDWESLKKAVVIFAKQVME